MKLHRQDGSEVELTEKDAQRWLKLGLATTAPKIKPAEAQQKQTKQKEE